jgi:hypothetical protein
MSILYLTPQASASIVGNLETGQEAIGISENHELILHNGIEMIKISSAGSVGVWESGSGLFSVQTVGTECTANGNYSHAEGNTTEAIGDNSHSEGIDTHAIGEASHAEGDSTLASGINAHSEGSKTTAVGNYSHAEGRESTAFGDSSHAENSSIAIGYLSHTEGSSTAIADYSHAEGNVNQTGYKAYKVSNVVDGQISIEGYGDLAFEFGSASVILDNVPYTINSVYYSEPMFYIQLVDISIQTGTTVADHYNNNSNVADVLIGANSHAEGLVNSALGDNSHAEGTQNVSYGTNAHAEGTYNQAIGINSHCEGINNYSIGHASHAEGSDNVASGPHSHASGYGNHAIGSGSFVEGAYTTAIGTNSHAEGQNTSAISNISHAEGSGAYAYLHGQYSKKSCLYQNGQYCNITLSCTTINSNETELTMAPPGTIDESEQRIFIPNNTAYAFRSICMGVDNQNKMAHFEIKGMIKNVDNTVTDHGIDVVEIYNDLPEGEISASADDVNKALIFTVVGSSTRTILWSAFIEWQEITMVFPA